MKLENHSTFSTPIRQSTFNDCSPGVHKKSSSFVKVELSERFENDRAHVKNHLSDCWKAGSVNIAKDSNTFFGLPSQVKQLFCEQRGVKELYEWQTECLTLATVTNGDNLVYSLPTSGGKTLVAEILMLKELLLNRKNVLFILPFVAIVQEKVKSFTSVGLELGFWVEEYAGARGRIPPVKRHASHSVLVATIEKAHSLVNALIESNSLSDLGLVIVDELHMIGEGGSRGACLEMTLTKLCIASPGTRIIGMSATLPNMSDLTRFLQAQLYTSTFRPVRLVEYVKVENQLYELRPGTSVNKQYESVEDLLADRLVYRRSVDFQYSKQMLQRDPDHVVGLVAETLMGHTVEELKSCPNDKRFSCLVFCPTKVHCENTARMLAESLPVHVSNPDREDLMEKRHALLTNLRVESQAADTDSPGGVCCPVLEFTVPKGIAYHHGGLTQEERSVLEDAYNEGVLNVLCCTSTLAAGVNLPARRVILRKPYIGSAFVSGSQYQQMVGRAGRAGLDSFGESVTILQPSDRTNFAQMLESIPRFGDVSTRGERCGGTAQCASSLLYDNGKGMRHLLLSIIGLRLATTFDELLSCARRTFYAIQSDGQACASLEQVVRNQLQVLISSDLVFLTSDDTVFGRSPVRLVRGNLAKLRFEATKLGRATIRGGLDTDQAGSLLCDLRLAARSLNTSGPLHLLYLVAPPDVVDQVQVDWGVLYDRISLLPPTQANLLTLLGFPEGYVLWKATGHPIRKKLDERPLRRLYVALALSELWQTSKGLSIWNVAERYKFSRGSLQSLLSSAASLATALAHALASEYSSDEELWAFVHLLPEFAARLSYCVSSELLPLMELPGVRRSRARQLYNNGYCTLKDIACATVSDLVTRLAPHMSRRTATDLIEAARMIVSERADALRQDASELLDGLQPRSVMSQLADDLKFRPKPFERFTQSLNTPSQSSSTFPDEDEDIFA